MVEIVKLHQVTVRELHQSIYNDEKKTHTHFFDEEKARKRYEELRKVPGEDKAWRVEFRSGYAIKDGQKLLSIMCFDDLVPCNEVQ